MTHSFGGLGFRGAKALFGYDYDPEMEKRVPNKREAPVVRPAFQLRLGTSTSAICRMFNQEGILGKTGKMWTAGTMGRMLKNRDYIGE